MKPTVPAKYGTCLSTKMLKAQIVNLGHINQCDQDIGALILERDEILVEQVSVHHPASSVPQTWTP